MINTDVNNDTEAALDLIRTEIPQGVPDWTENLAWSFHDPRTGISLYGHMGRTQPDQSVWESLTLMYLPGGDVLVNSSRGRNISEARNKEYECKPIIANKLWQFRFDGAMQRCDAQTLRQQPVLDEPFEAVEYHLIYDAVQPIYNMHGSDLSAERTHLEQGAIVRGYVVVGGKRIEIDCTGYRDHSVSRRTFKTLDAVTWSNCTFPSGKVFSFLQVSRSEVQILKGQVFQGGRMETASIEDYPDLTSSDGKPHTGGIRLRTDTGPIDISYEVAREQFIPFNLLPPTALRPGIDCSAKGSMTAVQCPAIYTWDGEVGYGWLERIRPTAIFA